MRRRSSAGLTVQYVGERRVRLTLQGEPILWACVERGYQAVEVLRRRGPAPLELLPPITSRVARRTHGAGAWLKRFARALDASENAPTHTGGHWQLTELRRSFPASRGGLAPIDPDGLPAARPRLTQALTLPRAHRERWLPNGSGGVYPLRDPSEPEAARVKAWRKHAREGSLPPLLLWWVSALDMYLILDGHDRLQAAALEGAEPSAVALWQPFEWPPEGPAAPWRQEELERYERVYAASEPELSLRSRLALNRSLVSAFRGGRYAVTFSVARPKLRARWQAEVEAELEAFRSSG